MQVFTQLDKDGFKLRVPDGIKRLFSLIRREFFEVCQQGFSCRHGKVIHNLKRGSQEKRGAPGHSSLRRSACTVSVAAPAEGPKREGEPASLSGRPLCKRIRKMMSRKKGDNFCHYVTDYLMGRQFLSQGPLIHSRFSLTLCAITCDFGPLIAYYDSINTLRRARP